MLESVHICSHLSYSSLKKEMYTFFQQKLGWSILINIIYCSQVSYLPHSHLMLLIMLKSNCLHQLLGGTRTTESSIPIALVFVKLRDLIYRWCIPSPFPQCRTRYILSNISTLNLHITAYPLQCTHSLIVVCIFLGDHKWTEYADLWMCGFSLCQLSSGWTKR